MKFWLFKKYLIKIECWEYIKGSGGITKKW